MCCFCHDLVDFLVFLQYMFDKLNIQPCNQSIIFKMSGVLQWISSVLRITSDSITPFLQTETR